MATRDNQGLQIALIIFVMLTIVLIVTTYMFFSGYSTQSKDAEELRTENQKLKQAALDSAAQTEKFMKLIAAADGDEAVEKTALEDIQSHGENLTDANQNYHGLVDHLVKKIHTHETAITDLTTQAQELKDKIETDAKATKAKIEADEKQMAQLAADLEKERKNFNDYRAKITGDNDRLAKGFDAKQQQRDQEITKYTDQIATLTDALARSEKLLAALRNKEDLEKKASEFPDGKIVHVNQRSRSVWLNVGPADGLRRQTSFVIVAPEDGDPVKTPPKATIEVVRLTGAHEAEARIVADDLSNPIMPGDNIFSVVWEAGRPEHFALAGKLDIDGDGEDDRQTVHNLINLNGGIIDAEVTAKGERSGKMSISTKYLILGDEPGIDAADREAYGLLFKEAQTLGVETLQLDRFLDYLGYKVEDRTVNLGQTARPADFKPRLPGGVQRVVPGSGTPARRKPRGAVQAVPY